MQKDPGHPEYYKLLDELRDLHRRKTNDYSGEIPLQEMRDIEEFGVDPYIGVIIRMRAKFGRLKNLVRNKEMMCKSESILDTLMDIASDALIAIIFYKEKYGAKKAIEKNRKKR